jgi:ketosteroid isomerase-like protein
MDDKDIAALVAALAPVIKGYVESVTAPVLARLATAERLLESVGPDLKTYVAKEAVGIHQWLGKHDNALAALEQRAPETGPQGDPGVNGKDADAAAITATVLETVLAKVAEIPVPKDGVNGADGRDGIDGKDADVEAIATTVTSKVMEVIKAIPVPKDGAAGVDGRDGKDGVGLAGAVIDRSGELVVTLTDGTQKALGPVIGKDGDPGKDGADGLGFDDMSVEMADDGRTIIHRWERGDRQKEARLQLAVVLDRGVFREDSEYKAGDGVTWGGSFWIAQREAKGEKPGEANDAFRLAVKRGRDGRDGVMKPPPDKGPVKL